MCVPLFQTRLRSRPREIALEHARESLAGRAGAAPWHFSVVGYKSRLQHEGAALLGNFSLQLDGPALQRFTPLLAPFDVATVALHVHSNQGNEAYTCVHRFSVH